MKPFQLVMWLVCIVTGVAYSALLSAESGIPFIAASIVIAALGSER